MVKSKWNYTQDGWKVQYAPKILERNEKYVQKFFIFIEFRFDLISLVLITWDIQLCLIQCISINEVAHKVTSTFSFLKSFNIPLFVVRISILFFRLLCLSQGLLKFTIGHVWILLKNNLQFLSERLMFDPCFKRILFFLVDKRCSKPIVTKVFYIYFLSCSCSYSYL